MDNLGKLQSPLTISEEIAEKIQFSIKNSVIGTVKSITEDTIGAYNTFIEERERNSKQESEKYETASCSQHDAQMSDMSLFISSTNYTSV